MPQHERERDQVDQMPDRMREEYQHDLNPHFQAGENHGLVGPHAELSALTAYDIKTINQRYDELSDDMLKQITIIPPGTRLEQSAAYIDPHEANPQVFRARAWSPGRTTGMCSRRACHRPSGIR
jgi:hypothetical protein